MRKKGRETIQNITQYAPDKKASTAKQVPEVTNRQGNITLAKRHEGML